MNILKAFILVTTLIGSQYIYASGSHDGEHAGHSSQSDHKSMGTKESSELPDVSHKPKKFHDHTSFFGGQVEMLKNYHIEYKMNDSGEILVHFSGQSREGVNIDQISASVVLKKGKKKIKTVKLKSAGKGFFKGKYLGKHRSGLTAILRVKDSTGKFTATFKPKKEGHKHD